MTRNLLFQLSADLEVPIREGVLRESDLHTIDELFITSTTREIMPVVSVDNRTIGSGQPGPITSNLLARLRALADAITRNQ